MKHNFDDSLDFSTQHNTQWDSFYSQAFPDNQGRAEVTSMWGQGKGKDIALKEQDGSIRIIQEKVRKVDYGDMLIEDKSNDMVDIPGWIYNDAEEVDFLAYMIAPADVVYLVPFDELQQAWLRNRDEWRDMCFKSVADNVTYNTISYCVPFDSLEAEGVDIEKYTLY